MVVKLKSFAKFFFFFTVVKKAFAGTNFEKISENLMGPATVITDLAISLTYLVGATLIILSLLQYRAHRKNPKLTPLSNPIIYFVLGVIATLIPHFSFQQKDMPALSEFFSSSPSSILEDTSVAPDLVESEHWAQ